MHITALINLPERYNPDNNGLREKIEEEKFEITSMEIAEKYGGGTWHHDRSGFWSDPEDGMLYWDEMRIMETDIPDEEEAKNWLIEYIKDKLLERFRQIAIYVKFVKVLDAVVVRIE